MLWLLLILAPCFAEPMNTAGLGDRDYAGRERAQRQLERRTRTWLDSMRLEQRIASEPDPEIRRRLRAVVAGYWAPLAELDWRTMPHIDALDREGRCEAKLDNRLTKRYYAAAGDAVEALEHRGVNWWQFHYATWLLVQDLAHWRVPPPGHSGAPGSHARADPGLGQTQRQHALRRNGGT